MPPKNKPQPVPPVQPVFAPDIEAKLARYPPAKQKNRRILLALYERGKTSQWQDRQLKDDGLIEAPLRDDPAVPDNDTCDTHVALAARLRLYYQNADGSNKLKINIDKKTVSAWEHGKHLGARQILPPQSVGVKRKWSLKAWIAWFDETLLAHHLLEPAQQVYQGLRLDDPIVLEQRVKRQKLLDELWESDRLRGGYIALAEAELCAAGFSRHYHLLWKNRNEKEMIEVFAAKAQSLGLPVEIVAVLKDFLTEAHQKFTDAVENSMEKYAGELATTLKAATPRADA